VKVTHVSLRATEAADRAGRPALTPELLAATGARYSRNNEGLESILAKIDPANLDRSVDGIFRMIDYGHQSIADMTPVCMFIDGVTMWLAYLVWSWCPTAGGQESSTRYIRMGEASLPEPATLGLDDRWRPDMTKALEAYEQALAYWESIGARHPDLTRIPKALRDNPDEKVQRQVKRMMRNYAFDRARYFLPIGLLTNMMLVMSARAWVGLCQRLLSHPLREATSLGAAIVGELGLVAPRLIRHAIYKESYAKGHAAEWEQARAEARGGGDLPDHLPTAFLDVLKPTDCPEAAFSQALHGRENRYDYMGVALQRTAVRFGWEAVSFAEIRDLNRHRTGSKYCSACPVGFYAAADEIPPLEPALPRELTDLGQRCAMDSRDRLKEGDPTAPYWGLLGVQFRFEHTTTADKFLYEAELRTGIGAHYRYARHLHDALTLWYHKFPETRDFVLEGCAEPE
jgi:thymidylate synthase ThyX